MILWAFIQRIYKDERNGFNDLLGKLNLFASKSPLCLVDRTIFLNEGIVSLVSRSFVDGHVVSRAHNVVGSQVEAILIVVAVALTFFQLFVQKFVYPGISMSFARITGIGCECCLFEGIAQHVVCCCIGRIIYSMKDVKL